MDAGLRTRVDVDREAAGRLGVTVQAVSDALNDAFGQRQVSTIYAQANQYRVVLEALPQYRSDPSQLNRLYVPSANGAQVPLTAIAKIDLHDGAPWPSATRTSSLPRPSASIWRPAPP